MKRKSASHTGSVHMSQRPHQSSGPVARTIFVNETQKRQVRNVGSRCADSVHDHKLAGGGMPGVLRHVFEMHEL